MSEDSMAVAHSEIVLPAFLADVWSHYEAILVALSWVVWHKPFLCAI
jgi:hypothetical protein